MLRGHVALDLELPWYLPISAYTISGTDMLYGAMCRYGIYCYAVYCTDGGFGATRERVLASSLYHKIRRRELRRLSVVGGWLGVRGAGLPLFMVMLLLFLVTMLLFMDVVRVILLGCNIHCWMQSLAFIRMCGSHVYRWVLTCF